MSGSIMVVGEALIDLVPGEREGLFEATPGGSPANVAVGLARLDVPVRLVARISRDVFGRRVRAHLETNGVDLSCAVAASEPTSLAIVSVTQVGVPEYDFRVDGTADWQWSDAELAGVLDERVLALHTGSLATALPPGAAAVHRLVERTRHTATISYDPNCRPLLMGSPEALRSQVDSLIGLADVVKASGEDIAWLLPGRGAADVAEAWLAQGPALVAITLGGSGVVAAARESGVVWRPGRTVEVVDTVGAGDSFVSALLAALYQRDLLGTTRREAVRAIRREVLAEVLDEAVLASALTCTRRGADPPNTLELHGSGRPPPTRAASGPH